MNQLIFFVTEVAMLFVSIFPLLAVVLLFNTRVQLASARGSSRDTTLATFNAALAEGFLAGVDSRVSVLIDQVQKTNCILFTCTLNFSRVFKK